MTRQFKFKKDEKIIRSIKGETPEILKLRMMINALGHQESNGMSRIYTTWSQQQNNKIK